MTTPGPARAPRPVVERRRVVGTRDGTFDLVEVHDGTRRGETLLLLHGWAMGWRPYRPVLRALADPGLVARRLRVVAPDLPGWGGSSAVPVRDLVGGDLGLSEHARRVAGLLDVLRPEGGVHVVGHSFGGGVALRLASRRPDLVRSLVLVNPVGGAHAAGHRPLGGAAWPLGTARWALGAAGELHPSQLLGLLPGVSRHVLPGLVRRPLGSALTALGALQASLGEEFAAVAATGLPVTPVWSDGDRLLRRDDLLRPVGAPEHVDVPGRHGWALSRPEDLARVVRDALPTVVVDQQVVRVGGAAPRPPLVPGQRRADADAGSSCAAPGRVASTSRH